MHIDYSVSVRVRVCAKAVILEGLYRQRFKQANVSHEYQRCRTFYKDHVKRYGDIDLDELERRAFARAAAREPAAAGPLPPSFLNAPPLPLIGPYQMVDVRSSAPYVVRSLLRPRTPLSHGAHVLSCSFAFAFSFSCSVDQRYACGSPDLSCLHTRLAVAVLYLEKPSSSWL